MERGGRKDKWALPGNDGGKNKNEMAILPLYPSGTGLPTSLNPLCPSPLLLSIRPSLPPPSWSE